MPALQNLPELYAKQISLTEWFEQIGHREAVALRQEDNEKRERLKLLHQLLGLPYDRPQQFSLREVVDRVPAFQEYFQSHRDDFCALRLLPATPELPKLRMRGMRVREVLEQWLPSQQVNPDLYRADFVPHPSEDHWGTIFIVNQYGIWGEIIPGGHSALTQGLWDGSRPITFFYDFERWQLNPPNAAAEEHLLSVVEYLRVAEPALRQRLTETLQATFAGPYLCGYFETTNSEHGTWFIDYNRLLGEWYNDHRPIELAMGDGLKGMVANGGRVTGLVRIVSDPHGQVLTSKDILVCDMTTPDYVPLMQNVAAIVTDRGGILCHAAIVARELGKPCIVGTGHATKILREGQQIEVDADIGVVRSFTTE